MNKKLSLAVAIIFLVIGVSMVYLLLKNKAGPSENTTDTAKVQVNPSSGQVKTSKGRYVDYTEDSFASTRGTKLLFFHASWCPQCRALDESIRASELPSDLTIFKVDYDSNQTLRAKYGVTLQTTVVKTGEKGDKLDSYVAYDEPTFQSVKQALLP